VFQASRTHKRLLVVFVCALACSVFCLANLAKICQYSSDSPPRDHLSKSTKMFGERCQNVSAAVLPEMPQILPPDVRVHAIPIPVETVSRRFVFLEAFRFRPPPVRIA